MQIGTPDMTFVLFYRQGTFAGHHYFATADEALDIAKGIASHGTFVEVEEKFTENDPYEGIVENRRTIFVTDNA